MKPRVVTFVSQFTGTKVAGLESQFFREFIKLSKFVKLIVISEKATEKVPNIEILKSIYVPIPKLRGFIKICSYVYLVFLKRNSYDLIYLRTFSPPELFAAIFAKKFLKKSIVTLIPGSWMLIGGGQRKRLHRHIYKKTLNISDRLVFYSDLIKFDTEKIVGKIKNSNDVIIRNPVDTDFFKPMDTRKSNNTIIFVGRIHPLKHIEDIIEAINIVKKTNDVNLQIVGPSYSDDYFQKLQIKIKELECQNIVHFIGPIPNDKIITYYHSSSIFVLLGVGEGMPKSILEAMSCEIPVISVPNAGIPDVIDDGINGFLVPNNSPEIIAKKIIFLLDNPLILFEMGKTARKKIKNEFTWDIFIKKLSDLFNSMT
jgi:glycosyltransferase involved in cell wall biosynthesis